LMPRFSVKQRAQHGAFLVVSRSGVEGVG